MIAATLRGSRGNITSQYSVSKITTSKIASKIHNLLHVHTRTSDLVYIIIRITSVYKITSNAQNTKNSTSCACIIAIIASVHKITVKINIYNYTR